VSLIHSNFYKPSVTIQNNPFRINIGFLLNQTIGYHRDFSFDIPEIEIPPDLMLSDFKGKVRINRTPQGLLVNAEFSAWLTLECVRCLENYHHPLQAIFNELYAFSKRSATESDLILPEDGYIDLQPLLREYLLIELPISPLCKEDCQGLCSVCGINRNFSSCDHVVEGEGDARG
jgi:uncharacterized protein